MFEFLIILLFISSSIGGTISIREYKLPMLEPGARICSLFIASLLLVIFQKFYNSVNFTISNQVDISDSIFDEVITKIDIATIAIDGEDLVITNEIDNFEHKSKFNTSRAGFHGYSIEFYVINEQGQPFLEESSGFIDIEPRDIFDIIVSSDSNGIELELVKR